MGRDQPEPLVRPSRVVRQSILDFMDRLPQAAAIVVSADYELLAWNPLATALLQDFSALGRRDRNLVRRSFLAPHPDGRQLYGTVHGDEFARTAALHLRTAAAGYPTTRNC